MSEADMGSGLKITARTDSRLPEHGLESPLGLLRRVLRTTAVCLAILSSMLVFPAGAPWLAAVWLAAASIAVMRDRPAGLCLFTLAVLLVAKGTAWLPGFLALAVVVCGVAGHDWWLRAPSRLGNRARSPSKKLAVLVMLWAAWTVFVTDWHFSARAQPAALDPQRPVVCIGDSLTSGFPAGGGYPSVLERLLAVPVVDFGREGMTCRQALAYCDAIVTLRPQAVVIELGGHDFLKGYPHAELEANLGTLIETAHSVGARVILMEIPRGFLTDSFHGIERELARRYDLEIIPDTAIRQLVLWSPEALGRFTSRERHLSDDGLHPNEFGDVYLAEIVATALTRILGPAVRKQ